MLPDKMTIGEAYDPITLVKTKEEASEYLELLVNWNVRMTGNTYPEARVIERMNIGYWAGYYDQETQTRIYELFETEHPIFGKHRPSPEEALKAGMQMAGGSTGLNSTLRDLILRS